NISKTQDTGASDGTIQVNTLVNPPLFTVEYRLDAGAWQDSPLFTGLAAGTYNLQVRYKDYTSCGDNADVEIASVNCDLFIGQVVITNEQSRYGDNGQLTILATSSAGSIEYSIDDGD